MSFHLFAKTYGVNSVNKVTTSYACLTTFLSIDIDQISCKKYRGYQIVLGGQTVERRIFFFKKSELNSSQKNGPRSNKSDHFQ